MVQMFILINMLNCLPPLLALCVHKHVPSRLIILIGRKNNHKIKIAGTDQLAVGIRPLGCKYTFLSFPKTLTALRTCMGQGVKRRVREKNGLVIVTYMIYIMLINMFVDFHHLLLF